MYPINGIFISPICTKLDKSIIYMDTPMVIHKKNMKSNNHQLLLCYETVIRS